MPYWTPYPRCVFCGERANSREHAIPAWIAKRLGLKGDMTAYMVEGDLSPPRRRISFASHRAKVFCKPCNVHFKHLEDRAIPLVEHMAKGWPIGLGLTSQLTLALWASKTAIALLAANAPDIAQLIPQHHRRAIRDIGKPPAETWVGYMPWEGAPYILVGQTAIPVLEGDAGAPRPYDTYNVLFGFGKLGFKVLGLLDGIPPGAVLTGELASVRRMWPRRNGPIDWPPPAIAITQRDMADLAAYHPLQHAP